MDLKILVKSLEDYAKLHTACDWDNVGLLVEPSKRLFVEKILVTCDLTQAVFKEALAKNINLIISYHPAIATPLKKLTQSNWEERSLIKCIENQIAVYSPHTTWDNKNGGINDWVMNAFETTRVESVESNLDIKNPCGFAQSILVNLPIGPNTDKLLLQIDKLENIEFIGKKEICVIDYSEKLFEFEFLSSAKGVSKLIDMVNNFYGSNYLSTLRVSKIDKPIMKNVGLGRIGYLTKPLKISELINIVKAHLKMKIFRLALGHDKTLDDYVSIIAVGAGCCTGLLNNTNAEFIITGEFLHEEIIHEVSRGVSLIVTDHTNTERGYLDLFTKRMKEILADTNVEIIVSEVDRDPLVYS